MPSSAARVVAVACGLLVLSNGPVFFVTDHVLGGQLGWEQPFTREVFVAFAVISVAALVLRGGGDGTGPERSPVGLVAVVWFTGWAVLSSLWSRVPDLTRGRSLIYVGVAAFAAIIAGMREREMRHAIGLAAGTGLAASLIAVVLSDAIGLDPNDNWRGIYTSRNSLAPIAAIAVITGIAFVIEAHGARRVAVAVLPVAGVFALLGAGSRTAGLAAVLAVGASLLIILTRRGYERVGRRALVVGGVVGVVGLAGAVAVIGRLWNESTFAQRRTIWGFVWDEIGHRPLHGHGWFSIWQLPDFTAGDRLLERGSAHNSFLEVGLGLGAVGLIPFVVIVALALRGAIVGAWRSPSAASWSWLALVLFLVFENLTESFVLWFSYNWAVLMAAALRSGVGLPRASATRTRARSEPATV